MEDQPNLLPKLRAPKINRDSKQPKDTPESANFHDEYFKCLRSKSYVDLLEKVEFLTNQPSIYFYQNKFSETLLEPSQETAHSAIETTILSKIPELKNLMLNYFDISAEVSFICSHILKTICQVQGNYQFVERALGIMMDDEDDSQENLKEILVEFSSLFSTNPVSILNNYDFNLISGKNLVVLNHLESMTEKVVREVKLTTCLKKTLESCATAVCDCVTTTTHTLTSPVMGPRNLNFTCKSLERELPQLRFSRRSLLKIGDQLDIATMVSYVLYEDFHITGGLIDCLYRKMEYMKEMVQFYLKDKTDKSSLQIVEELKQSYVGVREKVEELKEHACFCLMRVNEARDLVVKEMAKTRA